MPSNISGAGYFFKRVAGELHPMYLGSFSLAEEKETQDAEGYPVNDIAPLQILDTVDVRSTWTLTCSLQSVDNLDINEWIFGQRPGTISSISIPQTGAGTVPASSPYTLTVTGLTVDQAVDVTVLNDVDPGKTYLTQIASAGTPSSGEFEVTANTMTFHSSAAGKAVVYYYMHTVTNLVSVGGSNTLDPVEEFEMIGKYKTTRTGVRNIWLPRCKFNAGVTFDPQADSFERELKVLVPTALGWKVPYLEWETP